MTAAITLDNVTVSYDRHPAVHHVTGRFERGSLTAIAGPNGAGKSTLLKAIAGLVPVAEGHIHVGEPLAYLPQLSQMQRDFPMSVLHMVATGFWLQTGASRPITAAMKALAALALAQTGLSGFESRDLSSLSAGQFQRALFARLLVQDAKLILLDEPFNAIDDSTVSLLLDIIRRWHEEGRTVLCVLHHFDQIRAHFPDCLLLSRDCVAWGDSASVLQPENLLKAHLPREERDSHALCERTP